MTNYPPRVSDATHKRLACGACHGTGESRAARECVWCSGRGWNYAAPTMGEAREGAQS
jgi:hypothetical protein